MTRNEKVGVVEAYLQGLGSRDFRNVSFASGVTYESPLTPKLARRAAIEFLEGLFPIIKGVEVKQHVVSGGSLPSSIASRWRTASSYDPSLLQD